MKETSMKNFITFRNNFYKHVRRSVKDLSYDKRVPFIKDNFEAIFSEFDQSKYVKRTSIPFLKNHIIKKFREMEKHTHNRIVFHEEQIALTKRMKHVDNKEKRYIADCENYITYLKTKYSPKVPLKSNEMFSFDVFSADGTALNFFVKPSHNIINLNDYKIEKIHDIFYVSELEQPEEKPDTVDFINVVESRYYKC